ncbi:MAG: arsenate reductase family protein [Verrucomicrobiales bacterium]|jgi:arsenate reductase|nr:arsenate reductase family protein [Verrucomicrobiales bacterium]
MLKIYVYLKCDTCRKALKWLEQNKITADIRHIRETPPSVAELKTMLASYHGNLQKLFNTSGVDYKALNMKEKLPKLNETEALKLLAANGNLVKRPFLLGKDIALVGFKEDEWKAALR